MDESIKKDILSMMNEAIVLLKDEEYGELKELSNHTMHNASIFQDADSVSLAVIIYSISKIVERSLEKQDEISKKAISLMQDAADLFEKGDDDGFRKSIKKILKIISETDDRLGLFIEEVINQAEIKKGSKIYEHGISIARAAEMLGISQWELMNYVGKTTISELEEPSDVSKRVGFARSLFS